MNRLCVKLYILLVVAILYLFYPHQSLAHELMQSPKTIPTPSTITNLIKVKIEETRTVDFDGDNKMDYIVSVTTGRSDEDDILGSYLWITSKLKVVKRTPNYNTNTQFLWFINLDDDPVPEIISAFGYEDGIVYEIYKQNFNGKKDTMLMNFNPVLNEDKFYWGYPWDITDIQARRKGNHYKLLCSFNHKVEGDFANVEIPEWQKRVPIIFFYGKSTQPEYTLKDVGVEQWMDLKTMVKEVRRGR